MLPVHLFPLTFVTIVFNRYPSQALNLCGHFDFYLDFWRFPWGFFMRKLKMIIKTGRQGTYRLSYPSQGSKATGCHMLHRLQSSLTWLMILGSINETDLAWEEKKSNKNRNLNRWNEQNLEKETDAPLCVFLPNPSSQVQMSADEGKRGQSLQFSPNNVEKNLLLC